jgi:hypothetical protein
MRRLSVANRSREGISMRKAGVVLVSVAALLAVGLPPLLGMLTERQVRQRVAALEQSSFWAARVAAFDRGWFGSRARIELGISPDYVAELGPAAADPATAAALARPASIAVRFAHGPVAFLDGVHLGLSRMVARLDPEQPGVAQLEQRLGVPYLFEFRGRMRFDGVLEFDADVPPVDTALDDGARLTFSGAALDGTLNGRQLRSQAAVDSVAVESASGTLGLENLRARTDHEIRSEYLAVGSGEATIARVTIVEGRGATRPALEASGLRVSTESSLDETATLLNGHVTYAVAAVTAGDMRIVEAELRAAARNVDVAALHAYMDTLRREAPALAADPAALASALTPAIERGLAAGPVVSIEPLRFRLDDLPFDATITMAVDAAALPPAGALDLMDPTLWLEIVDVDAALEVAKPLAERLAALAVEAQIAADETTPPEQRAYMAEAQAGLFLVMLVGRGLLVDDGERYRMQLQLADGTLTLNGSPLPLALP